MDWSLINLAVLLPILLVVVAIAARRGCVGCGLYITKPMLIAWFAWKAKRKVKKLHKDAMKDPTFGPGDSRVFQFRFRVTGIQVRGYQTVFFLLVVMWFGLLTAAGIHVPIYMHTFFYWVPLIALYVDDLISTIDKDKWKKRFKALRNKVKWKWLPAPIPVGGS